VQPASCVSILFFIISDSYKYFIRINPKIQSKRVLRRERIFYVIGYGILTFVTRSRVVQRMSTIIVSTFHLRLLICNFSQTDFDGDGVLGLDDLERTCRQLTRGGLSIEEVATVCRKVLEESDIDGDGALSYLEFEHVVTRASDFLATFHIRI